MELKLTRKTSSSYDPLLIEGLIYQYKGLLKGFKPYYAKLLEPDLFILLKKTYDGKVSAKIKLEYMNVQVFPVNNSETEFVITYDKNQYLKLKAESPFKRIQWLTILNSYT